ncbi:DDB1- and CUL4-associated factor 11-like [Branchiostoma floridae]|uniref:DDB1- and CUL4-associated factor 11 homolog n=1 Tax=Branchiostoma floridae TaxID=7739 RepID=A0A9J7NBD0_BRAFL|nr:DDB1- and CUL4-associated factor 11-like [Branchiostoma floridae]
MSGEQDEQDDPDWGFDVIDGGDWSSEFESASGSDVSEFDLEDPGNLDWASFLEEAGLSLRPKVCDTSRLQDSGFRQVALRRLGRVGHRYGDVTGRTVPQLVSRREHGLCQRNPGFSPGHRASIGSRFIPNVPNLQAKYGFKAFCGQYSRDGNVFLTACQDQRIRVYDTRRGSFRLKRTIQAPNIEWSILDTALSSDGRYVVYSGWSDSIYVCEVLKKEGSVHQLPFSHDGFASCVFSLTFSHDDSEIMGAANDGCLYVFDRRRQERTLCIHSHSNDANAVTFADASSQILFSGGDDGLLKVWDRRMLSEENPREVGILLGHFDGITHIHSRGDNRFLISNSKDQTIKLWDIRKLSPAATVKPSISKLRSMHRWDYRWQRTPSDRVTAPRLPGDTAVMTYAGHVVLRTLIRCYFSPDFTTGQRFIYSGSANGDIFVYDVLTGEVAARLKGHRSCVRDVSWHPYSPRMLSVSWDCTVCRWECGTDDDEKFADALPSLITRGDAH